MIRTPNVSLSRRFVASVIAVALVAPMTIAPVAAAGPAQATRAEQATIIHRGTVTPAAAIERAAGVDRSGVERLATAHTDVAKASKGTQRPPLANAGVKSRIAAPTPLSVNEFAGLSEVADTPGVEPPDPWIAVSGSHIVQSVNTAVRISNRAGATLATIPTWSLFGLSPYEGDSDPRILWDPVKSRWVGVLLSYQADFSLNYLNLAISEGSDPMGAWDIFAYPYADEFGTPTLPDYPGIASSSDKVVLTANEFYASGGGGYAGSSVLAVKWSDLLAGGDVLPVLWTYGDQAIFNPRPALVQSASADVHLVAGTSGAGEILYAKLSGLAPALSWVNLSDGVALPTLCGTVEPRQPGPPETIFDAVDGRITDAVWRNNRLAFVSTCGSDPDTDTNYDDFVRVTVLTTTLTPPAPATLNDDVLIGTAGIDSYMGGVGWSTNGSLFLSYTESSPSQVPTTKAAAYVAGNWTPSITVDTGEASYTGEFGRWGDYVGVAPDPSGSAAVWQSNQVAAADGTWRTTVSRLVYDQTAPVVTGPTQALVPGSRLGFTVPVRIGWTITETGSGVVRSNLSANTFGLGYLADGAVSGTTTVRNHYFKAYNSTAVRTYQYAVNATDGYGNVSSTVAGSTLSVLLYQQFTGVTYSTGWSNASSSVYSGGSVKYSTKAGASASFKTSGRSFGFVSYRSSTRGKVKIYVDGVYKGTSTLTSSTTKTRNIVYAVTFPTTGTHTIKLVVASGRVDVDAFVVLK